MDQNRKKRASGYSFATMLILVGVLGLIILSEVSRNEMTGLVFFFICLIPAVGIYVYLGCTSEKDNYNKIYKPYKSRKSEVVSSSIWLLALASFFIIGFIFDGWDYAWVVFLIGAAIQNLTELFNSNDKDNLS
ncbi:hypothetical protein [Faecalimicrobium dakarense]|uniref:hypothetical protein n=1 Tax=Faecalimicrobium dakarense TaxID=1301100 RepID=UPI0004B85367|nr:hypothetical protein [[Clostridium] dakarense]